MPFVYVGALRTLALLPVREVGGSGAVRAAALIAALSFATSRLFWSQVTITEVYTFSALFSAVLLVLSLWLAIGVAVLGQGVRRFAERTGTFSARVEGLIWYNILVVPIYVTDDERSFYDGLNLVPEGELFKVEF